jgi:anaerobic selenocysteine-containing dehydrogenase
MAEEMETPGEGQIRALVVFAGNPVLTTPNGARLARAVAGLEFVAAVDFFLNETTRLANVVLPPLHVLETGNFELFMPRLSVRNVAGYSARVLEPPPGGRDDWDILSDLAARVTAPRAPAAAYRAWRRAVRDLPERAIDLLLRIGRYKLSLEKLRAAPHGIDLGPLREGRRHDVVRTVDRRVRLAPPALVADVPRLERWVDERARSAPDLVLVGRRHLRSNNSWMHGVHSLVKGPDRRQLLMHPDDVARLGLSAGARVRVASRAGSVSARLASTTDVMPGVVSLPHGFGDPNANAITDEELVEPVAGTSILNGVPVTVTLDAT